MAKTGKNPEATPSTSTAPVTSTAPAENDFLPSNEWVEIQSGGAAVYKGEVGLAEGKPLQGIPYDVIFALGGSANVGVWECIVFRATEPTVGTRGEETVEVLAGEDVLIPTNALLSDIARTAINPNKLRHTKVMPKGRVAHATKKGWEFWDFRIGLGPFVMRAAENLFRLPEREDILEKIAAFEKRVNAGEKDAEGRPLLDDGSVKIIKAYHQRLRVAAAEAAQLAAGSATVAQLTS